jgi:cell division protein FtsW
MAARVGVDKWLFFTTLVLVVVGLVMVFSASAVVAQERYNSPYTFVGRQALWALAGVAAMLVLMQVDSSVYKSPRFIYPPGGHHAAAGCRVLLSQLAQHPSLDSLRRLLHFQPSEIAKPVAVLFLAWFLHTRLDDMRDWKTPC